MPERREERKSRVRNDVIEAALRLMSERGFDSVTVDELAAACDISTRTVFRYFETKDDIVVAPLFAQLSMLRVSMQKALSSGDRPLLAVVRSAREFAEHIDRDGERMRLIMRLLYSCRSLRSRAFDLERAWEATVAAELAATGVDPFEASVVAGIGISVLATPVREWAESGDSGPLVAVVDTAADVGLGLVLSR